MNFELRLIESITNNFSEDQKVGSGGYGDVYMAKHNGEEIAVKRLHSLQGLDDKEFGNEFRNLTNVCHKNILRLIGYCYESRHKYVEHKGELVFAKDMERVLCFEYMQCGSLDKHIADDSCRLDWPTCYEIIKGTYLGLSKLVSSTKTHKTETVKGTQGYMPPEYVDSGFISKKFDVFSFGVIIIKILAGDMGYFQCTQMSPEKFAEIVSENWKERLQLIPGYSSREMDIKQIRRCTEIAIKCVDTDPQKRPCVTDIVHELEELEVEKKKMSEALILLGSCDRKVVSLDPNLELCFLFESRKELSCCLQITNQTDDFIAFNVKINRNKYSVQPSQGTMPPRSKRYIIVTMEAQAKAPPNMRCHDILLLQSTSVSGIDEVDYQELFKMSRADKVVDVVKLPIVYAIVSTTKD
ncbi:hypothetical protein ACQ4PT_050008 [Festuca glaucescens]